MIKGWKEIMRESCSNPCKNRNYSIIYKNVIYKVNKYQLKKKKKNSTKTFNISQVHYMHFLQVVTTPYLIGQQAGV